MGWLDLLGFATGLPTPPSNPIEYTQTSRMDWSETVTCSRCHQTWKASIQVLGRGSASAEEGDTYGLQNARERSGVNAFIAASDAAKTRILRSRCPGCGRRFGGMFGLALKSLIAGVFIGAIAAAPFAFGSVRQKSVFIAVSFVVTLLIHLGNLQSIDDVVRFERLTPLTPELVERTMQRLQQEEENRKRTRVAEATTAPEPTSSSDDTTSSKALELDFDRSWNKQTKRD